MVVETELGNGESRRRFRFDWIFPVLLNPRQAFAKITSLTGSAWLTPMFFLSITTIAGMLVTGYLKQQAALSGGVSLPPGFEYYPPEQQTQFMQAQQVTQGPVFNYVLPAFTSLSGVWIGWLLVSGMVHLVLTLLGGRGDTIAAINLVAWSSLPFALRDLVRVAYMLVTKQMVQLAGLAGFVPAGNSGRELFLVKFLGLVDIYVIWHIILLIAGVTAAAKLSRSKAAGGVIFTILIVLLAQATMLYLVARFANLSIVRPFFF